MDTIDFCTVSISFLFILFLFYLNVYFLISILHKYPDNTTGTKIIINPIVNLVTDK